jgi:hypothetical protein
MVENKLASPRCGRKLLQSTPASYRVLRWQVNFRSLETAGKVIWWYTTGTDIDDRKRAEKKLQRSEWNLLKVQRLGHPASWSIDIASGVVTASPELLRSVGFKPGRGLFEEGLLF